MVELVNTTGLSPVAYGLQVRVLSPVPRINRPSNLIMDFAKSLLLLYPEYSKVLGPYLRADGRKHLVLTTNNSRQKRTLSYPKALLEVSLGRKLVGNETTDHVDGDKTNDAVTNLQVLSLAENVSKSSKGHRYNLGRKQPESQKRRGSKNGMAKLNEATVENCRNLFASHELSKEDIQFKHGLSRKAVENMLYGISYANAGGIIAKSKGLRGQKQTP